MAMLTGIIVDVSGSMKENASGRINVEGGEWARSIFKVIDDLVKHDVSNDNHVFSVGVGASCGEGVFDIIKTVEQFQNRNPEQQLGLQPPSFDDILEEFYQIVERNGAKTTRRWASKEIIKSAVSYEMATLLLTELKRNTDFLKEFVDKCLPSACKDFKTTKNVANFVLPALCYFVLPGPGGVVLCGLGAAFFPGLGGSAVQQVQDTAAAGISHYKCATPSDVVTVVEEAKGRLLKDVGTIFSVHHASNVIHGCVDEEELNDNRIEELLKAVELFIYGRTPLFTALEKTREIFTTTKFSGHKKLLFVLSDGEPTDEGDLMDIVSMFKDAQVTVVSCLITRSTRIHPRKLFSLENSNWDEGAKFLFKLSSTISTHLIPRTIFIKRGWDIDITNNETKLFIQVNHPDNIHDACDLARNVACCQDALSDLLVSVSLDIYINQSTTGFTTQRQVGGTCYANASAAVLHLAMKRILGRDGGYPDFNNLRTEMINLHGQHGANTLRVLQEICPRYRLHCQVADVKGTMEAITAKRPVVATFRLTDPEWDKFSEFYRRNPTGILTKSVIDISKRLGSETLGGHAVVLTSFNSECFRFMNSWGDNWADMGFFRVQNAGVLDFKFTDVYWTLNDLSSKEKVYYQHHGAEVVGKLIRDLKGLQMAKYECPLCKVNSLVTEYSGSLLQAVCPKCRGKFRSDEAGNILALNMYLLSLSR